MYHGKQVHAWLLKDGVLMKALPGGQFSVLLVDDDTRALELTRILLLNAGIGTVLTLSDSRATLPFLEEHDISLVILDLMMPHMNGVDLLPLIHRDYPHIPVIVETGAGEVDTAVKCMKSGAIDYLVKPVEATRLVNSVKNALNFDDLLQEVSSLKNYLLNDRLEHAEAFAEIKTTSRKMRSIFQYAEVVASSPQPVLITGETGVGKELFAHSIHRISSVKGEFVCVNVAGLDDAMFSDTLFGHKKGAFTGADQFREGLVSKAGMGTLFLDEIGDLNELSQVKLLRLLQEREYYPVGADTIKTSSARIVLATNIDLEARIKEGRFRRDLYYRLCTHQIHIPALRERPEDIPLLLTTFIDVAARHFGKKKPTPAPELISALVGYAFPGNVRELHARVFDAMARYNEGMLTLESFPGITASMPQRPAVCPSILSSETNGIYTIFGRLPTFREIEDYLIGEAMKVSGGSQAVAASMLGVTRQTISNRLKSIST